MTEDRQVSDPQVTGRQADADGPSSLPPPREADDRFVTVSITMGWAVALAVVAVLAACDVLPAYQRWWVWTCATGFGLGLWGVWFVPVLKRYRTREAERRAQLSGEPSSVSRESGSKTVSSTETPGSSTRS
ncbi:MAG TPA: DUF2530 domain-containing protein [Trebonia sp.]|nr:DUF2530 domain-containing protein [Trebonia sp.]